MKIVQWGIDGFVLRLDTFKVARAAIVVFSCGSAIYFQLAVELFSELLSLVNSSELVDFEPEIC